MLSAERVWVGVDVGGPAKGFHGVALQGRRILAKKSFRSAGEMADWCWEQNAAVVAVDSPCRWRGEGSARLAERELGRDRISSFSTPTELQARGHPFYSWMMAGATLYAALTDRYPVYDGGNRGDRVAIETFPQAVACALAGEIVSAKKKKVVRRELLRLSGIDATGLTNIDEVDAALCALAAERFGADDFKAYGDAHGGFIIVPQTPSMSTGSPPSARHPGPLSGSRI